MLIEIAIGRKVDFKHGVVKAVDGISDCTVVEYTSNRGRLAFCAYVKMHEVGVEYENIDDALLGALAHKYTRRNGLRDCLVKYLLRILSHGKRSR